MILHNGSSPTTSGTSSRVFVLDINSNHDIQQQQYHHQSAQQSSAQQSSTSVTTTTTRLSETMIHRRIIEMYKYRDEFDEIDLNISTCKTLSGSTKVDLYNALQHMKDKANKKLRRLSADIDYIDPTVHEFILLNILSFNEIEIKSAPDIEMTNISVGLTISLRHALTLNQTCLRSLYLCCNFTDETCNILCDGLLHCTTIEYLRLHIVSSSNSSRSSSGYHHGGSCGSSRTSSNNSGYFLHKILQSLLGKSKLKEVQLDDVTTINTGAITESLASLLDHSQCQLEILNLIICDWQDQDMNNGTHHEDEHKGDLHHHQAEGFDSMILYNSLCNVRCNSIKRLLFHGSKNFFLA